MGRTAANRTRCEPLPVVPCGAAHVISFTVSCPSETLTVWTSAWLYGGAASDDVLDALRAWAGLHEVAAADEVAAGLLDLPSPGAEPSSPALLLAAVRKARAGGARMVLPVPGDVRGLPGAGPFSVAALRAGEAVLFPGADVGLVPEAVADGVLRWTVHALPTNGIGEYESLADAEHGLRGAVRDAAAALSSLEVARHRPGVREEITAALEGRVRPGWPAGTPARVLRVLEQADEVAAIVAAADGDDPGGALSASAAQARSAALRTLASAVRTARCAALAEAVRALTAPADRH